MGQIFKTNTIESVWQYLQHLKIPITKKTVNETLQSHPFFPSLYSISDSFDKWKIKNVAYELNEDQLDELKTPFTVYMNGLSTGKDFVLVTDVTKENVSFINETKKTQTLSRTAFLNRWEKLAFIAEPTNESGEENYQRNRKQEQKEFWNSFLFYTGIGLTILFLLLNLVTTNANNLLVLTLSGLHVVGTLLTCALLTYESGNASDFVKSVCSMNKQTNCNAVLSSEGAKLFGISWGEYGLFYFAGGLFWLLVSPLKLDVKLSYLTLITLPASLYIPFSIYYQYKIVKHWCPLCLAVQLILAFELVAALISMSSNSHFFIHLTSGFTLVGIAWMMMALIVPIGVWFYLKPLRAKANNYNDYKHRYKRLQYNPDLFAALLQQEKKAPDGWQTIGIEVGNPNATNVILKICNPYCGPCAKAHNVLEEIIKRHPDYKLRIIFTSKNNEGSWGFKPARHLITLSKTLTPNKLQSALHDWYSDAKKDFDQLATRYPVTEQLASEIGGELLTQMSDWCEIAEITGTPTLYLNGYKLPQQYSINELKTIL
ncbi:MAG: thioredoxin domain-containing protein [Bacteroidia bacterium]|nr:thioredoxin domain-containing protein [Bacteroidia bacterium]